VFDLVCDICSGSDSGAIIISPKEMRRAMDNRFNPFALNLAKAPYGQEEIIYQVWKREWYGSKTNWAICPNCYRELRRYL